MARIARPLSEVQPPGFGWRHWQDVLGSALSGLGMLLLLAVPLLLLAGLASLLLAYTALRLIGKLAYRRLTAPSIVTGSTH